MLLSHADFIYYYQGWIELAEAMNTIYQTTQIAVAPTSAESRQDAG